MYPILLSFYVTYSTDLKRMSKYFSIFLSGDKISVKVKIYARSSKSSGEGYLHLSNIPFSWKKIFSKNDLQPQSATRVAFLSLVPVVSLVFLTFHTSLWYFDPLILNSDNGQSFIFLRLLVLNKDINPASPGIGRFELSYLTGLWEGLSFEVRGSILYFLN